MQDWQKKAGDVVLRRQRIKQYRLRRVLDIPALYSAGYGNVGSSIYYALGIVAMVAMGATPVALGIAAIIFVFTALTYAEGATMFPEAGGSATFARKGFNLTVSFFTGWALLLTYITTISLSAFTIPPYLGYFWPILKESTAAGTTTSMAIVFLLMLLNIIGIKEASWLNFIAALIDIVAQVSLVILGFLLLFSPDLVVQRITLFWPSTNSFIFGIAMAALAYTGVETVAQMSEETRKPETNVPRAMILMIFTVLIIFAGISLVAFSIMTPEELATRWATDPVAGIANGISNALTDPNLAAGLSLDPITILILTRLFELLSNFLRPMVGVLAAAILLIATNAGMIGISRLAFSMSNNHLVPSFLGKVHPNFRTPYVSIIVFTLVSMLILVPGFITREIFSNLGALYTFGSLITCGVAHASIVSLRIRSPELNRPFKLKGNITIRKRQIPLTAVLGFVFTFIIWLIIIIYQPYTRQWGFGWMLLGLVIILWRSRKKEDKSKTQAKPPAFTSQEPD